MVKVLTILSGLDGGGVENILLNYYQNMDRDKVHIDFIVHSQHKGKLEDKFENLGSKIVSAKLYSVLKRTIKSHFRFNRPLFQTLLLSVHSKA